MDPNLVVGNLCTLMAMGTNSISSTRKSVKGMLVFQSISQLIYCASAIVLRGYSAAVQNVVSIIRNLAAIKEIKSRLLEWTLVAIGLVLGIAFNNRSIIGLLPVLGNFQYTLAIFWLNGKKRLLKLSFLLSTLAFLIFNIELQNYVGIVSDSIVIITTAVVLIRGEKAAPQE